MPESALNLRLALAAFGLVVCVAFGLVSLEVFGLAPAIVFFVLLFSPITFPVGQLPEWFQTVHDYLPARPAADLLRAGLVSDVFDARVRDLVVLTVWCAGGVAISLRALVRRG